MECLPQVFSHFDFHRRNLLIRQREDGGEQVVGVDWSWCGCGCLGGDLFSLIGGTAQIFEIEADALPELETVAFESYLAGLSDAGWAGDPELVRLGYNLWFAMLLGVGTPLMTVLGTAEQVAPYFAQQFGRPWEKIASGWANLCELALERADLVRQQMDRLL